ncbi:hypothetical protein [Ktedonospora formicarum]|uniref:Uncharacterized protein n=1 Tax=Ktedonospora formicarum TaxID=2778364 RepID=A0A8J3I380_9CHLR|nr:hypothetical protein [Ktedonospora formicarum]GHO45397.1 hypothetical protein KSX_35600 [Ktedonospora formicarum]
MKQERINLEAELIAGTTELSDAELAIVEGGWGGYGGYGKGYGGYGFGGYGYGRNRFINNFSFSSTTNIGGAIGIGTLGGFNCNSFGNTFIG